MTTSGRLLKLLSLLQTRRDWPGEELAQRLEVSGRTIRRDIERLRELGYPVQAHPGAAGGYQLARPAAEITLLDVVRIFEDPEERVMCPFGPHWCGVGPKCPLHETFSEMQQQALQRLALESFAQFEKSAG